MFAFHNTAASVCRFDPLERFQLDDRWNVENATALLRAALAGIDALSDELSAGRAKTLLDEDDVQWVPASLSYTRRKSEMSTP
jgi:hypothetical protein